MSESSPADVPTTQGPATPQGTPSAQSPEAIACARIQSNLAVSVLANKKKRKAADDADEDDEPNTYKWLGRNMVRLCGPYERIHPIVEYGVKYELTDPDDRGKLGIIKNTIPTFAEDMVDIAGDVKLRKTACSQIQLGLRGARGDDCGSMKKAVIDYLLPPPAPPQPGQPPSPRPVLTPPIPRGGVKAYRGQNHPVTAAALRPICYPDTPETYAAINAGDPNFKILGKLLLAFMFAWGQVYDKDDVEDGYLESHTMRAAVKHVCQGPGSALEGAGSNKGKAGNAAINGIKALTGREIIWNTMDGDFCYSDFYWKVVDSLRSEEGQAILDRFNHDVFGSAMSPGGSTSTAVDVPDEFELMQQQRAAKRARLAAAAAEADDRNIFFPSPLDFEVGKIALVPSLIHDNAENQDREISELAYVRASQKYFPNENRVVALPNEARSQRRVIKKS
ncbi:hypothetical protein B0H13DRAFT_1850524 [Mycena leptocephala]|nr:hypothetical protein B0H13DRAFT_1850524 [Mycena leptocephala]